nr:phage tail sheath subtilisin-like domain-containing protein [uncultured Ottowia sp.]
MSTFHHGVSVTETLDGQQVIRTKSPSVIGLIATADDADNDYFPLNVPKLVTKISDAQGKAGTKGTLSKALRDIADQVKPVMVIVRVPEGAGASETEKAADQLAKTIGTNTAGAYTGAYALLGAETITGVKPKIIGAPYLDAPEAAKVLVSIAKKLHGVAYIESHKSSVSEAIADAGGYGDRECMIIYGRFTRFDVDKKRTDEISPIGCALGLRARIDAEMGWHKTLSNVPVSGVTGVSQSKTVHFDLVDANTDANLLNEAKVSCLIHKQGFRFWGNRTTATDDQYMFESYTRTAQVLRESIAEAHFAYIDRPLTPSLARDIIENIAAYGRDLVANNRLLGFKVWYSEDLNETAQLKAGKLTINYEYTPVPPLEHLHLVQSFTDKYLAEFATRVASAGV